MLTARALIVLPEAVTELKFVVPPTAPPKVIVPLGALRLTVCAPLMLEVKLRLPIVEVKLALAPKVSASL